jgi:hypothetical protein
LSDAIGQKAATAERESSTTHRRAEYGGVGARDDRRLRRAGGGERVVEVVQRGAVGGEDALKVAEEADEAAEARGRHRFRGEHGAELREAVTAR